MTLLTHALDHPAYQAEHLHGASPCALGLLIAWQLASKNECHKRTWQKLHGLFQSSLGSHIGIISVAFCLWELSQHYHSPPPGSREGTEIPSLDGRSSTVLKELVSTREILL